MIHIRSLRSSAAHLVGGMAVAAMLSACTEPSGNDAQMAFDTYAVGRCFALEGSAKVFQQDSDLTYADSVSLILPLRLQNCNVQPLRDTITSYALGVTGKPILPSINEYIERSAQQVGFKTKPVNSRAAAIMAPSFDIVSGFVAYMSPEVLVYCVRTESQRAGAAHGMTVRRYINYLLRGQGKVLTLTSLFTPEGLKQLPDRIAEQALSLSDIIGPTSVDGLPANDNFYLSSEGEIVFSYQPYEIASYAQGTIDIPFYPYELSDLMTPEAIDIFNLADLEN